MKIEWAYYQNESDTTGKESDIKKILYKYLDKDLYNSKYKGYLFCISDGCNAMIKFTHRKNGKKFYSTWNGQGEDHDISCPYYLRLKGKVERKKILEQIQSAPITDEHIAKTIANKSKNLKMKEELIQKSIKKKTKKIIEGDSTTITTSSDNGEIDSNGNSKVRIFSLDSNYITPDYIGYRKCVFGKIKSAHFDINHGYAYINLANEQYQISIYFPESFYSDPVKTTKAALQNFINTIEENIKKEKELVIICVGMIRHKEKKKGLNVHVINPIHLMVNDLSYNDINTKHKIIDNPYRY